MKIKLNSEVIYDGRTYAAGELHEASAEFRAWCAARGLVSEEVSPAPKGKPPTSTGEKK